MSQSPLFPRDWQRQPPALAPDYKTSVTRSPSLPLLSLDQTPSELNGPTFGHSEIGQLDANLIHNFATDSDPVGERIIIHGHVRDENARPVPNTLVEIWQANAGGRYRHIKDGYLAALDPNFGGCGRTLTGSDGSYAFHTIKPGAYPWRNHGNNWRPAHVHFSVFGSAFGQRLITQMYFEGDPLIDLCPIYNTVPDAGARNRLVASLDLNASRPFDSIAYRFDIVLRGRQETPFENRPEGG